MLDIFLPWPTSIYRLISFDNLTATECIKIATYEKKNLIFTAK